MGEAVLQFPVAIPYVLEDLVWPTPLASHLAHALVTLGAVQPAIFSFFERPEVSFHPLVVLSLNSCSVLPIILERFRVEHSDCLLDLVDHLFRVLCWASLRR